MSLSDRARTSGMMTFLLTLSLATGLLLPTAVLGANAAEKPTSSPATERPLSDSILRAVLWMRLSAEYEALCRQVYASALERVRARLAASVPGKPPAVILDLDETVLDNGGYQAYLALGGLSHSQERWQAWQQANVGKVGLVPGARDFIKEVEKARVHVIFVTNRAFVLRDQTAAALVRLGVTTHAALDDQKTPKLLMRTETSSKESRRQQVRDRYTIIANVGDNLNDFDDDFGPQLSNEKRRAGIARHADKWGTEWFVLPNPIYGYWLRSIQWDRVEQHFGPTEP